MMYQDRPWTLLQLVVLLVAVVVTVTGDQQTVACVRRTEDGSWDCDCGQKQWPMVLPAVPNHVEHVRIRQCVQLRIPADTFAQAAIVKSVQITDIDELLLENGSLMFRTQNAERSITVTFTNVNIPDLASHSIHGHLDELQFDNCRIGRMHAFAVMPTRAMQVLSMQRTSVEHMDRHVFKKFSVAVFTIRDCEFKSAVPSTLVKDVAVTERLVIAESNFTQILPNAFQFDDVTSFELSRNQINEMSGSSFHMRVSNQVRISGNTIKELSSSSFLAITSTYPTRPQENLHFQQPELMFADNRVDITDHPFRLRFDTDSFAVVISKLSVITPIACAVLAERLGTDNAFLRSFGDSIYFRMNDAPTRDAGDNDDDRSLVAYSFLVDRKCVADQTVMIVVASTAVVVVALLVALAVVWWLCRRRRVAIERMTMVQPEPKTYRETQIVIQIENAGLLKTDL